MAKKPEKKVFNIRFEFYARGKRRKPSVGASIDNGITDTEDPDYYCQGLRKEDDYAYSKLSDAAHEFCKYLIEVGEL